MTSNAKLAMAALLGAAVSGMSVYGLQAQGKARRAQHPGEKATWLQMAHDWLRMIPQADPSASDKFDAAEQKHGTHQTRSDAEH